MIYRKIIVTAILLFIFALIGTTLVSFTFEQTDEQIKANERATLLRNLHKIIPPQIHDNDLFKDSTTAHNPTLLGDKKPIQIYRARKQGKPIAAILSPVAPDGYNGNIRLLVGIYYNGEIAGVRIINHRETPGLGDQIEEEKSDWVLSFNTRSIQNLHPSQWHVKKDGGIFDQFTGATITPRAIVKAVHKALIYYQHHREQIFAIEPSDSLENHQHD